jgi:hypothetical protein
LTARMHMPSVRTGNRTSNAAECSDFDALSCTPSHVN